MDYIPVDAYGKLKAEITGGSTEIKLDVSSQAVSPFLRYLYYYDLTEPRKNLGVAVELFSAAGAYEVVILWNAIAGLFMEVKDLDMKTACAVFEILVKFEKMVSGKKLGKKLVALMTS